MENKYFGVMLDCSRNAVMKPTEVINFAKILKTFGYNMSIMILVYVVLGGIGNIRGSMIAAIILYVLPEMLRGLQTYRMLIYAVVLIVMMIYNWAPKSIAWRETHSAKDLLAKVKGVVASKSKKGGN